MDAEKLDGFGLNGAIFARFSDAIDRTINCRIPLRQ